MIILGLDALDLRMVEKYNCQTLLQLEHGQTDLSDFPLKRTVALWSSFITGKNLDSEISVKAQWEYKVPADQTFFKFFKTFDAIDVPGYSHKKSHDEERQLLKRYFENHGSIADYEEIVWKIHEENKREFFSQLSKLDLLMGYFNLADSIGHLSFGIESTMSAIYQELEILAKELKGSTEDFILTISDHGMEAIGRYGDHSNNGFYSVNRKLALDLPKITDFYNLLGGVQNVT